MRKSQQVLVAGDQGVRLGSQGECQEWTVKRIAAIRKLDLVAHSDGFTPRQVIAQQVLALVRGQCEFGYDNTRINSVVVS